ncbi:LLM class flavin-dependent oxidoreductase [Streptomyces sp. NPDC088747]|uniref:LLM class flavin-dependent oxidoreductase n=1 Tax=Streptomyces sp. NPDC088747 TaxID=3365886 RepID=UPI00381D9C97
MKVSVTCMNSYADPAVMRRALAENYLEREAWDPTVGLRSIDEALRLAALSDELGFDFVSVSEHHYTGTMTNPNPAVTAAALTQVVKRAGIGLFGPLASLNNPVRLAEEFAMIDQFSGGRLTAMPLRGTPNEFPFYNVPEEETTGRTREAMLLIKKALTEPRPFAWKGEYFDFPIVSVWPGPTQLPHPPLFGSANSPDSAVFAAEHGFGAACSYFGPLRVAELMELYRQECAKHGWTPRADQMLFRAFCVVGQDERHAQDLARRFDGSHTGDEEWLPTNARDAGFAFGLLQFQGDPDTLVEQITAFHETTGVGVLDLSFNFGQFTYEETADQMRLFAAKVLPRIKHIGA